jgi:hypothetical protein
MDWKNKFERTVGMNTAIMKAQQDNFLYSKMLADMELKNKTLHECCYYAHSSIEAIVNKMLEGEGQNKTELFISLDSIKNRMEEILNGSTAKQALALADSSTGIVT